MFQRPRPQHVTAAHALRSSQGAGHTGKSNLTILDPRAELEHYSRRALVGPSDDPRTQTLVDLGITKDPGGGIRNRNPLNTFLYLTLRFGMPHLIP
jgi:hypothetical protein